MKNIYILGAGNMGQAILFGLRKKFSVRHLKPIEICVERAASLAAFGFEVADRIESIDNDDVVVLAVPPQNFKSVVRDNQSLLGYGGTVLSVMAGVTVSELCGTLVHARIVRSIPNIPAEVGEGVTLYYVQNNRDSNLIAVAEMIFGAIGVCIRVEDECQIDSGTALAGGGPALVAYFANALLLYAEYVGLNPESAWKVIAQLLYGTSLLLKSTNKMPMKLCDEVQTKGGTTEQAILVLEQHGLNEIVLLALAAAAKRSEALGRENFSGAVMSIENSNHLQGAHFNDAKVFDDSYSVYCGLGHCINLFYDAKVFKVSPAGVAFGSLITRYVNKEHKDAKFLDLGTGSGVHSLLLKSMGVGSVTGSDISTDAIVVAKKNEFNNFGVNTIEFFCGDLFQGLPDLSEQYDVILFNPPGWRTPSDSFLQALDKFSGMEGLPIDSMFYGDRTLGRFFKELPNHLVDGGKVIIGLNSLVGIREVMNRLRNSHEEMYVIDCRLLERHDFPLLLYSESWARVQDLLVEEILSWTRKGDAYCNVLENGQIFWSYEIVELTFWKK